jgi:hypothetical protein
MSRDIIDVFATMPSIYIGTWASQFCNEHGYKMETIRGNLRVDWACRQRQHFFYEAVKQSLWSLPRIGKFIGKHHTTVLHSAWRYADDNGLPQVTGLRGRPRRKQPRLFDPFRDMDEAIEMAETQ